MEYADLFNVFVLMYDTNVKLKVGFFCLWQLNGSKDDSEEVKIIRNALFAELRSEFHDEMSEMRDELSGKILNTSNQLVRCYIVLGILS